MHFDKIHCFSLLIIIAAIVLVATLKCPASESFVNESGYQNPLTISTMPGPNIYQEKCGPCLPTENNPDMYTQKCAVYESTNGYPLLYYTMDKTCMKCKQMHDGSKKCMPRMQPGYVRMPSFTIPRKPEFCA